MQSAVLNSLNHDIMASYPLRFTPISNFPKSGPTFSRFISVRLHP